MNKNNIMALNEKNSEKKENIKKDNNNINNINNININKFSDEEDEKKIEDDKSKQSINNKDTKEIFKSVHDSDTLIDKEIHLIYLPLTKIPSYLIVLFL